MTAPSPEPTRRRRWPWVAGALLLIAGLSTVLALNRIYAEPSPQIRQRVAVYHCARNLGRIGVALLLYAERHGDGHRYPASLDALFEKGLLLNEKVLICPAHEPSLKTPGGRRTSYRYTPGLSLLGPDDVRVVDDRDKPHRFGDTADGLALETDLDVWRKGSNRPADGLTRARARGTPALIRELREGPDRERVLSAWRLWRLRAPASREALRGALRDRAYEVQLYAGLALLALDDPRGVPAILRALRLKSLNTGGFVIDGPRRRWLIDHLRADPRTRPVPLFAYDPVETQREALSRWLGKWEG